MSGKKKLMNEVLPDPKHAAASTVAVRRRVVDHLRKMVSVGAATVSVSACTPFAVVDPLPQPARCAKLSDLITDLTTTAARATDGGQGFTLTFTVDNNAEVGALTLNSIRAATGGTIGTPQVQMLTLSVVVTPTAPMVELFLDTTCRGAAESVHVVIDTASLQVTLSAP